MLAVIHGEAKDVDGRRYEASWCVYFANKPSIWVVRGFARQLDAEIAMRFLLSLPVDWSADAWRINESLRAAGYQSEKSLMRAACEHLQW